MTTKDTDWRPGPTVCRCCLTEGCYKDISTEYFWMGKREVYSEMLAETLNLAIAYSQSGGPNSNSRLICEACISRLRDASDFKRQVVECEKTFMQHLDSGSVLETEIPVEQLDPEVKLETVKLEKRLSDDDDDFDVRVDFLDDDDDDLDDQPLTKLASKIPKKESVDLMDLLDNSKAAEKRKSSTKAKPPPPKKLKVKKEVPKPTASTAPKPEKKKKDPSPMSIARRNAEIIVTYATVYPFRLPDTEMMCVYCCESYSNPKVFREHMDNEHPNYKAKLAFAHCNNEIYLKADCSELKCRICSNIFDNLVAIAKHLNDVHNHKLDFDVDVGIYPFKFINDTLLCGICDRNFPCKRSLSRHIGSHYQNYTCEHCGKSYSTNTSLQWHKRFSHIKDESICKKCKKLFSSSEAMKKHVSESQRCWGYQCCKCLQRFISRTLKEKHMVEVHGFPKKTFNCSECAEVFSGRDAYRTHFATMHSGQYFKCAWCERKFINKRKLQDHIVVHTGEKTHQCSVCSKMFARKANLSQHIHIHDAIKRFECSKCKKQFNQKVSYKSHMQNHHPEVTDY